MHSRQARRLALAAGAAGLLSACVSAPDLEAGSRIAPDSPLTAAIAKAQADPSPFPKFTDIPNAPTDLRPKADWARDAAALSNSAAALAQATAASPEMPDPGAWARQVMAESGLDAAKVPGPETAAEIEAYARELRERATPPPPPQ